MRIPFLTVAIFALGLKVFAQAKEQSRVIDLKSALSIAKENYPSVKMKRAGTEAAAYELRAAQNNYLPGVMVQGQILNGTSNQVRGVYYSNEGVSIPISSGIKPNGYTNTSVWTSSATGLVNWKFFSFGKFKTNVDAARAGVEAAQADFLNEVFQQQIKVGDAYFLSLVANDVMRSQRANLVRVQSLRDVTKAYTKSGLKPGVDSSLVNAEFSKATLQFLEAQRIASEQLVYLRELMGLTSAETFQLDTLIYSKQQPQPVELTNDYAKNPRLLFSKVW